MKNENAVLAIRFQSTYDSGDLMKICREDLDVFRRVPGLAQKYYLSERSTGAISGIYLFEADDFKTAFLASQLAKNIPVRYGVIPETLRVEQYDMALVLNDPPLIKHAPQKKEDRGAGNGTSRTTISREIIMHHLQSFQNNELAEVMSDYTADSILITPERTFTGPGQISHFFISLMAHFPKQGSNFQLDTITVEDDLAYIVWHADTPSLSVALGSDTFVLKEGKIHQQTFAGDLRFDPSSPLIW